MPFSVFAFFFCFFGRRYSALCLDFVCTRRSVAVRFETDVLALTVLTIVFAELLVFVPAVLRVTPLPFASFFFRESLCSLSFATNAAWRAAASTSRFSRATFFRRVVRFFFASSIAVEVAEVYREGCRALLPCTSATSPIRNISPLMASSKEFKK